MTRLVLAVHNSTAEDPALCLASAGKIGNRDESGYDIAWCLNLEPYTALLNLECLFIAKGTNSPAGAVCSSATSPAALTARAKA